MKYMLYSSQYDAMLKMLMQFLVEYEGNPKIMSSVLDFAEIVQLMHKTASCQLSDHLRVTQVNISSTRSLALGQCTSFHSLYTK